MQQKKNAQARNGLQLLLLAGVIAIATFFRFWNLSTAPPSLSHDEVAIGYNAYSILKTGKDEYGTSFPFLFRSFDDYKLPGYVYAAALSEKLFGLNEFAVRFPSAFFGVLTVVVLYFLISAMLRVRGQSLVPLMSAAMLAISPWHINFSRAAFESNASLFFITLSVLFLLKSLEKKWYIALASLSAVASVYFYYTSRVVLPIIMVVFIVVYRKEILALKKWILLAIAIGLVALLPIFPHMLTTGFSRINQVSMFEDKKLITPFIEAIVRNDNALLAKTFYNRRVVYLQQFVDNYLKNFSFDFYFTTGTGDMGLLYIWEVPFFLYGLFIVLRIKERWKWIILAWYFSVPIASAFTTGQPNALRTLANVPMVAVFSSFGIYGFFSLIKKARYVTFPLIIFIALVVFFLGRFIMLYFDYTPHLNSVIWGDGHQQMAAYVADKKNSYDTIYISGDYWRPYIYLLFYMKYSPSLYQKKWSRYQIENIYFGQAAWDRGEELNLGSANFSLLVKGKTLFILSAEDFRLQDKLIGTEKRPYKMIVKKEIDGVFADSVFFAVQLQ